MGRHERKSASGVEGHGLFGTLVAILRLPRMFVFELLVIVVSLSILSVVLGNRFGSLSGAIVGIAIAPYVVVRLLRRRAGR